MSPYTRVNFVDVVYEDIPKYKVTNDAGNTVYAGAEIEIATPVSVPGTPLNADTLNRLDEAIYDLSSDIIDISADVTDVNATIATLTQVIEALTGKEIIVTLTNTQRYPFNDSLKAVVFETAHPDANYTVYTEVTAYEDGGYGDIEISERTAAGFKIAHTGAASSVTVRCVVRGIG